MPTTNDNGVNKREFPTGATRDTAADKHEYAGFLSPIVLQSFGRYMHKNRFMRDGSVRASDNWQKGIPVEVYEQSLFRHWMDTWALLRGEPGEQTQNIEEALNGMLFNTMGLLYEFLHGRLPHQSAVANGWFNVPDYPCGVDQEHGSHIYENNRPGEGRFGLAHCPGVLIEVDPDESSGATLTPAGQALVDAAVADAEAVFPRRACDAHEEHPPHTFTIMGGQHDETYYFCPGSMA